jgi:protein O-GlcNAc transferase
MPHMSLQQALDLAMQRHKAGNSLEAEQLYRQILNYQPNNLNALHLLGALIAESGRADEAVTLIRRALGVNPSAVECWGNLGIILSRQGKADEAVVAFQHAAELTPQTAGIFDSLGSALQQAGQLGDAVKAYRRAISIRAGSAAATRIAPGELELVASDNLLVLLHLDPANDAKAIFDDHALWNRLYGAPLAASALRHDNDSTPDRRLKVGYVSAYLSSRPVGRFLSGLFANHDHGQFEVFCYSDLLEPDATTQRLRGWSDVWRDTANLSHEQLAQLIRDDRIDLLIDLGMHTKGNRMPAFAHEPAPVQITYLAYCSTTGLQAIDYRLSDAAFDPDDSQQLYYSEQTVRLRSYWCYPPPEEAPDVSALPAQASPSAPLTFGCLNDFTKVNQKTLLMWGDVLQNVPNSRLILHAPTTSDRRRTLHAFATVGVEPARIEFVGMLSMGEYFKQYRQIDIALDPTPWCGGTTTCDALWMGVPVVSLAGHTAISRGGLSILSQLGLTELVAHTPQEYVAIASALALDPLRLTALRASLRERIRASPLMDAPGFTRDFESILRQMWRRWRETRIVGLPGAS